MNEGKYSAHEFPKHNKTTCIKKPTDYNIVEKKKTLTLNDFCNSVNEEAEIEKKFEL